MLKNLSLTRHKVESMIKVKTFLDGIERNSKDSRNSYHGGLTRFQDFLDNSYNEKKNQSFTVETILQSLTKNEIDVYELLDTFVSYLMTLSISVNTTKGYLVQSDHISAIMILTSYQQSSEDG